MMIDRYYGVGLLGAVLLSTPVIFFSFRNTHSRGTAKVVPGHPALRALRKAVWGTLGVFSIFMGSFVTVSIIYNQFVEQRVQFASGPPILHIPMGIPFILVGMTWLRRSRE